MTLTDGTKADVVALNADVVGYSKLMADDVDATAATMEEYRQLVEHEVAAGQGTMVTFVGDNFMAVFPSAEAALKASISITSEIERRNVGVSGTRQVRFRMGIDQGEVSVAEGRYFGDALNIAARIQAIATGGGVSVSGRVYRSLDEPALRFRSIGSKRLKNIPEDVDVYEFADLPTAGASTSSRGSLELEDPSLTVLPIITEHVDDSVRSVSEIIRSDMVHRLSQVPQLKVIDGITQSKGSEVASRYMVETGVHQVGNNVRIYAALFDVPTMNIVKSHKWTVDAADLFDVSETLANEVARAIEIELIVGEPAGLYADLGDPDAINKIYLGWYYLRNDTEEGWSRAIDLFGEVAETHPDKPFGFVLSAFANWIAVGNRWGSDPKEMLALSHQQAQRGAEIGDPTGLAQAVIGAVLMSQGRDEEALEVMDGLQILRPTCDVTFGLEGSVRRYMGQWERSVDLLDVAMRLTGVNKPWYPTVQACSLFMGGRLEQAAQTAEMVLEYQPNNLEALAVLAAAQVELGMVRSSKATAGLIKERFPAVDLESWIDRSPYQDRDMVERWKSDLITAGAIDE
jgi:adenylate cyclase